LEGKHSAENGAVFVWSLLGSHHDSEALSFFCMEWIFENVPGTEAMAK
jgi:hypothetical protein